MICIVSCSNGEKRERITNLVVSCLSGIVFMCSLGEKCLISQIFTLRSCGFAKNSILKVLSYFNIYFYTLMSTGAGADHETYRQALTAWQLFSILEFNNGNHLFSFFALLIRLPHHAHTLPHKVESFLPLSVNRPSPGVGVTLFCVVVWASLHLVLSTKT